MKSISSIAIFLSIWSSLHAKNPSILSHSVYTFHDENRVRIDSWAYIDDSNGQININEVKVIAPDGKEFKMSLQSGNFYYGTSGNYYGQGPLPLGNAKIVVINKSSQTDTANTNISNVIEELPIINYPQNGDVINQKKPMFDWDDVQDQQLPILYEIRVLRDDWTMIWSKSNLTLSESLFDFDSSAIASLQNGNKYYLQLYAIDAWGDQSYRVTIFYVGEYFKFICHVGEGDITYKYLPQAGGSFSAFKCETNSLSFYPSIGGLSIIANGNEIYPWNDGIKYKLLGIDYQADTLQARWQMQYASEILLYSYKVYLSGRRLIIKLNAETPNSGGIYMDKCMDATNAVVVRVPYLQLFNILYSKGSFTSMYVDWEQTNCSEIYPCNAKATSSSVEYSQEVLYKPTTTGRRNLINETIYLACSQSLSDVMPDIINPVSQYKNESANRLILDISEISFAGSESIVKQCYNLGIANLWVINHVWQFGGYDNMLPDTYPANPVYGGSEGLISLSNTTTSYGYLFAVHENYVDFYPNAPSWNTGEIALNSDGSLKTAWFNGQMQSYEMKPSRAVHFADIYAPQIHRSYSTNSSYIDTHASANPSVWVDYDSKVDHPALFKEVVKQYRSLAEKLRGYHVGPVSAEGKHLFLYTGYFDDFVACAEYSNCEAFPLLVDFDLEKIHPLVVLHGIGPYISFFKKESVDQQKLTLDSLLVYMATELAYGHGGRIVWTSDLKEMPWLEYKYVFTAQRLYALANVVNILYNDNGEEIEASEYIRRHPNSYADMKNISCMSQIRVVYNNGVVVCVNRNPFKNWELDVGTLDGWFNCHVFVDSKDTLAVGTLETTHFTLPPKNGWVVFSPPQLLYFSLEEPTLVEPENNSIRQPVIQTFTWKENPLLIIDYYKIQVSRDRLFHNIVYEDSMVKQNSKLIANLDENTRYYWRISERNKKGSSAWSDIWTFTTQENYKAEIILGPSSIGNGIHQSFAEADGMYKSGIIGNSPCSYNWLNNPSLNKGTYLYFSLDDNLVFSGTSPNSWITVDYYDTSATTRIGIEYDSPGEAITSKYKDGGFQEIGNTRRWKSRTFSLKDAYFGNRENGGSDFRFYTWGIMFLKSVYVTSNNPEVASIAKTETLQQNEFVLYQNYPNPFNQKTTIEYSIPVSSIVSLEIFDILGRLQTTLVKEEKQAGTYQVNWDASSYPSGVYFYHLQIDKFIKSKKFVILR